MCRSDHYSLEADLFPLPFDTQANGLWRVQCNWDRGLRVFYITYGVTNTSEKPIRFPARTDIVVRQPSPFLIERLKLELDRVDLGLWGGTGGLTLRILYLTAGIPVERKKIKNKIKKRAVLTVY